MSQYYEDLQQRICGRKKSISTEDVAKVEARRLHKLKKIKFEHYPCAYCGGWHVGAKRSREAGMRRSQKRAKVNA